MAAGNVKGLRQVVFEPTINVALRIAMGGVVEGRGQQPVDAEPSWNRRENLKVDLVGTHQRVDRAQALRHIRLGHLDLYQQQLDEITAQNVADGRCTDTPDPK